MMQKRILVVDDEAANLQVLRNILEDTYELSFQTNSLSVISDVERLQPDLILQDIKMPDISGYDICRKLQSLPETASIPLIFVTTLDDVGDEELGFEVGAVDYIVKPLSPAIVRSRVATHLKLHDRQQSLEKRIKERTQELLQSQHAAITMLGEAGHYNDTDTGNHLWRMAAYAGALARASGWPPAESELLELAAPMHDMGKIGIPDSILKKPGKLDAEEWQVMMTHTTIGHQILYHDHTTLFRLAADIALCHHEKWDGTGYPNGLSKEDIPFSARVVAIADVFDALTTRRPYKEAWPDEAAFEEIHSLSGTHFDPNLVTTFLAIKQEIQILKIRYKDVDTD